MFQENGGCSKLWYRKLPVCRPWPCATAANTHSVITIIGSCTSTPTPKLIYAWPRELGKRNNFVGAKRNRLGVYLFVRFYRGFQFSLRASNKILFQTHLLTCKCHPVRFNVITIIGSRTSTPTPKLICHHAGIVSLFDPNLIELIGQNLNDASSARPHDLSSYHDSPHDQVEPG